jgi:deoxyribodipyrimidine photolyase-like uncharacterized protein
MLKMYSKTCDRRHFHRREASHATKAAANGMVPWARDEFDPYAERFKLIQRRKLLKQQFIMLSEAAKDAPQGGRWKFGRALREHKKEMAELKVQIHALPRLLTVPVPETSIHKLRRLQRLAARHVGEAKHLCSG